jgi:predicted DNA-binding protein with PD1-like motif
MQTEEKDNLIFVRLFPGEDVFDSLRKVCEKYDVETAVVLSGLGQLGSFELGFFKEKGNYLPESFIEPHELLSLTGNISRQEEGYNFHLHASFSNMQKQVVGGHFIKGVVSVTGEIVLLKTDLKVTRKIEDETGLSGLFLD